METISEIFRDLGYANRGKNYPMTPRRHSMMSNDGNVREVRASPPLLRPSKMPQEIMGDDEDGIKSILIGYRKAGHSWEDYSKRLDGSTREMLTRVFRECRRNGFMSPSVIGDRIVWMQVVGRGDFADGCTLCNAKFNLGECRGKTNLKRDFIPCWFKEKRKYETINR